MGTTHAQTGNKLQVVLRQEVGDRVAQRSAFSVFNTKLRESPGRMAGVLRGLLDGQPASETDTSWVDSVETVLTETKLGSQIGFGADPSERGADSMARNEWVWGKVFDDRRHRAARHDYHAAESEVHRLEQLRLASDQLGDAALQQVEIDATMWEVGLESAQKDALAAKRVRALTTLLIATELNLPPAELLPMTVPEQATAVTTFPMADIHELSAA